MTVKEIEVFETIGYTLRRWLLGRISIMTINGSLPALGLWFLGVPLAVPIVAVVFLTVKMLYIEDLLGNNVKVNGEKYAKKRRRKFKSDINCFRRAK